MLTLILFLSYFVTLICHPPLFKGDKSLKLYSMNSYPAVRIVYDFKHQASATKKGVVSIEIYYKGKRKRVNTGVRVFPSQWNNRHGVVKSIDAAELNLTIHTVLQNITDWINQLRLNRESFSFEKLERYLLTERTEDDNFLKYVERKIDGRKDIRESTRRTQRKLVGSLKEFGKIMFFSEVTRERIREYDMWLHGKNYVQATIHSYHKFLKIYINQAIDEGLIKHSPYTGIKIERGKSSLRKFLTEKELISVMETKLPTESLNSTRDLFVFQCFTSLYLEYYLGRTESPVLDEDGNQVFYTEGAMAGKPKYQIKHSRKKENLNLNIWLHPRNQQERMQNRNTLALAEKIRFEREQSFLEDREGYRLRKDMDEDFLEFCNEFIKSPALTKYTRITLGHGLQKFKNFLADTPRYSLYRNNLKMTQLTVDMVADYVEYLKENGTGDGPKIYFLFSSCVTQIASYPLRDQPI